MMGWFLSTQGRLKAGGNTVPLAASPPIHARGPGQTGYRYASRLRTVSRNRASPFSKLVSDLDSGVLD